MSSGAFYPGFTPWNTFDGDYTLTNNNQTMVLPTTLETPLVSFWHDTVDGLDRISWSGTATGNFIGRASLTKPDSRNTGLFEPQTWSPSGYSASENLLPTSYGWNDVAAGNGSMVGGKLRINATTRNVGYGNYQAHIFDKSDTFLLKIRVTPRSGTGDQQFACTLPIGPLGTYEGRTAVTFGIGYTGTFGFIAIGGGNLYTIPDFAYDKTYDIVCKIQCPTPNVRPATAQIYFREVNGHDETDCADFLFVGNVAVSAADDFQKRFIGGYWNPVNFVVDWDWAKVFGGDEWFELTSGQTSFTNNWKYWQFKSNTISNGTLTEFNISSNLSAPDNVSTYSQEVFNSNSISVVNNIVANANGYDYRLIRSSDDVEIARKYNYDNGIIFTDVANGIYKLEIRAFTDDGIRSATALTINNITIPEPATSNPIVTLNLSDLALAPTETSILTYTIPSGVDLYWQGSQISGSGTLIAASGVNGPAASVVLSIDDSNLLPGESATLSYSVSGNVSAILGGNPITNTGTSIVATAVNSSITPPNQPTSINIISEPSRPTYIGIVGVV